MSDKIILHIPHSSTNIPEEYVKTFSADNETIKKNLIALTDYATDDLFDHSEHQNKIILPISRLLCDVERYQNDEEEIMSKKGMGVLYTKGANGETLRQADADLREEIINKYYKPHHDNLLKSILDIVDNKGYCIIIDAHSFPSKPLPYEIDQNLVRPDFCIGTDSIHTPESLIKVICNCINSMGYSFELNRPYSGTMIPLPLYNAGVPIISVMIEVYRKLYMYKVKQCSGPQYEITKKALNKILDVIDLWSNNLKNKIE